MRKFLDNWKTMLQVNGLPEKYSRIGLWNQKSGKNPIQPFNQKAHSKFGE